MTENVKQHFEVQEPVKAIVGLNKTNSTKMWKSFFCAVEHKWEKYLMMILREYDIGGYIVGLEKSENTHQETNGEHFHFCVEMTELDYNKYRKRCFIDKFGLRGQAKLGQPRQYGKVKQIENIVRMKAYTIKDGNFRTNLTETEIAGLGEIAFKKGDEETTYREQLLAKVRYMVPFHEATKRTVGVAIIKIFQEDETKKYPLSSTRLESYIRHFFMYYQKISPEELFDLFYPRG